MSRIPPAMGPLRWQIDQMMTGLAAGLD